MPELKALGTKQEFQFESPMPSVLEWFPNPQSGSAQGLGLLIETDEFSSLCPKTGQPDWARIIIRYGPDKRCVESKSLKLYLAGYRQFGIFHEACVNMILNHLVTLLDPEWMVVEGRFSPRGGIKFWPVAVYNHQAVPALRRVDEVTEAMDMDDGEGRSL